jgi:glucokinase
MRAARHPGGELVENSGDADRRAGRQMAKPPVDAIGVAVPGIIRHGVVEDSPNLTQIKGMRLADELTKALAARGIAAPVYIANDADAIAAGVAATRGQLNKLTRVWTIGNGIGYGRWPYVEGVWEGGHVTVTLDPQRAFLRLRRRGPPGRHHGLPRHAHALPRPRAGRGLCQAKQGDTRCREFVDLWHRALAAATASFIHLAGPGALLLHRPQRGLP